MDLVIGEGVPGSGPIFKIGCVGLCSLKHVGLGTAKLGTGRVWCGIPCHQSEALCATVGIILRGFLTSVFF